MKFWTFLTVFIIGFIVSVIAFASWKEDTKQVENSIYEGGLTPEMKENEKLLLKVFSECVATRWTAMMDKYKCAKVNNDFDASFQACASINPTMGDELIMVAMDCLDVATKSSSVKKPK